MSEFGLLLAQAADATPKLSQGAGTTAPSSWLILAVIVAIFAVPILLGNLLARVL